MSYVDDDGRWDLVAPGVRVLVEPSQEYRDRVESEFGAAAAATQVTEQDAVRTSARLAVSDRLADLPDHTITEVAPLFDPWVVGEPVEVGDVRRWDGTLVQCLQAHTTQADWEPNLVPALWKIHRTDDGTAPVEWQPGLALTVDDQVTYDGVTYDVLQAHTTQEGWEPPNVPSLFAPVDA